jgi:TolB protein
MELLDRVNAGESTQSVLLNGIDPLIHNEKLLGLDDCTCQKTGATGPIPPVSLNPPGQGCREGVTSLYADYRALNPGQEVVIPIIMCNAHDVANMDLTVTYDSSVLQFKNAVKGSLNANMLFDSNNVGNTVKIAFAGKSGFSGTGSIAVLTFTIIGQKGSSSPITIQVNEASTTSGAPVDVSVQNGQVSVGNNNPNNPGGNPDGKPTSLDALKALQMSVGKLAVDLNYDLTKDGKVTSGDAREILKLVVQ